MKDAATGAGSWHGVFSRGQACPHYKNHFFQAEFPGAQGVFFYVSLTSTHEEPFLDVVFPPALVASSSHPGSPLPVESVRERLAWAYQLRDTDYVIFPRARSEHRGRVLLSHRLTDGEGILHPAAATARRSPLTLAQLLGAGIQACRAGAEIRAQGISVGSPGLWGLYVMPNRNAALIGGGLRWMLQGEELAEIDDLRYVRDFLAGFFPPRREGEEPELGATRSLLGSRGPADFALLGEELAGLYRAKFGLTFALRSREEPEAFDESVDRAIGIANLGRIEDAISLFESLALRVKEVDDGPTLMRFWANYAALLIRAGRVEEGLALIDERGAAEDGTAWRYRAWALDASGRVREAEAAYRRAVELADADHDIMMDYAVFCYRRDLDDAFRDLYPRMVEHFADDLDVWTFIGDFYAGVEPAGLDADRRTQRLLSAREAYEKARGLGADPRRLDLKALIADRKLGEPGLDERLDGLDAEIRAEDPDALTWLILGYAWGLFGRTDRAEECYRKAHVLDPDDPAYVSNLVDSLRLQEKHREVIQVGEEWCAVTGNIPDANMLNNLGIAHEVLKQDARAEEYFHRAVAADPLNATMTTNLMDSLRRRGAAQEARELGERFLAGDHGPLTAYFWNVMGLSCDAVGQPEWAAESYRSALQCAPENPVYAVNTLMTLRTMEAHGEAVELGEEWCADPSHVPTADLWNNLGISHGALGSQERAAECYRNALAVDPTTPAYLTNLVNMLRLLGRAAEAVQAGKEWLAAPGHSPDATLLQNLAVAAGAAEDHDAELAWHREAMVLTPEDSNGAALVLSALRARGENAEAKAWGEEWLRRAARSAAEPAAVFWNQLGAARSALSDFAAAERAFREAFTLDPVNATYAGNLFGALHSLERRAELKLLSSQWLARPDITPSAEVWNAVGLVHHGEGDFQTALSFFQKASALSPSDGNIALNVVESLRSLGRHEEGISVAESWLSVEGRVPGAGFMNTLGFCYFQVKRLTEAHEFFRRAVEREPGNETYAGNLKAVAGLLGKAAAGAPRGTDAH